MIINSKNINDKLVKKLTPKHFYVRVSFLSFINTGEENGLVLYKENDIFRPFCYKETLNLKKIKAKTYSDLIKEFDNNLEHIEKTLKKAKTMFYDEFETSCKVKVIKELFELGLIDNEVTLTKHIVCVISELDNIERTFENSSLHCEVVNINKILVDYKDKIEGFLNYFLINS